MHKSVLIKFKLGRRITGILSQVCFLVILTSSGWCEAESIPIFNEEKTIK